MNKIQLIIALLITLQFSVTAVQAEDSSAKMKVTTMQDTKGDTEETKASKKEKKRETKRVHRKTMKAKKAKVKAKKHAKKHARKMKHHEAKDLTPSTKSEGK